MHNPRFLIKAIQKLAKSEGVVELFSNSRGDNELRLFLPEQGNHLIAPEPHQRGLVEEKIFPFFAVF